MAITAFARACSANKSGCLNAWFGEIANVGTPTVSSGEITALTGSATYHRCQADIDELDFTEEVENTPNGSKVTIKVTMKFTNLTTTLAVYRAALLAASPCGIVGIVTDSNGKAWLLGWNETDKSNRPLRLISDSHKTGKAPGEDGNNTTIVLQAIMTAPALPFNSTLSGYIANETTGSATFLTTT